MMMWTQKIVAHDAGLPEPVIRKRRKNRRVGILMLTVAVGTALAGWPLFGSSVMAAIKIREQSPSLAIVAYALLIVSSITLVLGLWYLLLAQVERVARMVDGMEKGSKDEKDTAPASMKDRCGGA